MKKAKVIYNPTSGKEQFRHHLSDVVEFLSNRDYIVELYPTKQEKDAINISHNACFDETTLLVVSGGDGTLHEVVNGLANNQKRPEILYLPAGTTNDFANSVEIPLDINNALRLLDEGTVQAMDVGKIGDIYFVYVACFGAFTKVSYTTPSKLKSVIGPLAYVLNGVGELPKMTKPFEISIESKEFFETTDATMFFVINSTRVAGLKRILPNAKLNDGMFDVVVINGKNIRAGFEMLKNITTGFNEELNSSGVVHFETNKISVSSEQVIKWNLDGELGIKGDVAIECLQQHIKIYVPTTNKALNFRGD